MPSLLGISARALLSFQQGMNTTGHNIANVNTPGYSRQRVNFSNTPPRFLWIWLSRHRGSSGFCGTYLRPFRGRTSPQQPIRLQRTAGLFQSGASD